MPRPTTEVSATPQRGQLMNREATVAISVPADTAQSGRTAQTAWVAEF